MENRTDVWPGEAEFCARCGSRLDRVHLHGMERGRCGSCGRIDFRSPSVGVAAIVRNANGELLMVQREPGATQAGKWCMPAGFVDYGEDVRDAAAREVFEETGLRVSVRDVVHAATNFHDPEKVTVSIWFTTELIGGTVTAGDDAADAGWFSLDSLPPLAFDTDVDVIATLR